MEIGGINLFIFNLNLFQNGKPIICNRGNTRDHMDFWSFCKSIRRQLNPYSFGYCSYSDFIESNQPGCVIFLIIENFQLLKISLWKAGN
jgi:hypothetical protein